MIEENKLIYSNKLSELHKNELENLVLDYISSDEKLMSLSYFRFFYFFYLQLMYVDYGLESIDDKNTVKDIFKTFLLQNMKNVSNKYNRDTVKDHVRKIFSGFNYLYKIFFKKHNIYYQVYFNNLIKYFLPLPYDVMLYSPFITFRSNVKSFYKKNNIDYLDKITNIDTVKRRRIVQPKNVDILKDEIDIHIPLDYFNPSKFSKCLFLIGCKNDNKIILYIANKCDKINDKIEINYIYQRVYKEYNFKLFFNGMSFEYISNKWDQVNAEIKMNIKNVFYISVMRKINKIDLYNFFYPINFKKEHYKYLFHNTKFESISDEAKNYFKERPTFLSTTPILEITEYFTDRNCIIFKLKNDINNLLDLTIDLYSRNKFNTKINEIYKKHKASKIWEYYDNTQIMQYYKNKNNMSRNVNKNNRCITIKNINTKQFIQERPYCDINNKIFYTGRRKLQEILFKTRKYSSADIWIYKLRWKIYKEYGHIVKDDEYYDDTYYSMKYKDWNIDIGNFDVMLLLDLDVTGFFSTDYDAAIHSGGEVLLFYPGKYIEVDEFKKGNCCKC